MYNYRYVPTFAHRHWTTVNRVNYLRDDVGNVEKDRDDNVQVYTDTWIRVSARNYYVNTRGAAQVFRPIYANEVNTTMFGIWMKSYVTSSLQTEKRSRSW
jgi:hypothetical protein